MKYYLLNATLLINIMVSLPALSNDLETALKAYEAKNYLEAQRLLSEITAVSYTHLTLPTILRV